tara:strand:+ start:21312 stop:22322 length:1011 start_codon:yes stop_codon:yes gene_type:complete
LYKPILNNDSINIENVYFFVKRIVKKYFKIFISLSILFVIYFFIKTPGYSSQISFYTNYNQSNKIPSSLGFITNLGISDSDLGFSVGDYIRSEKFANDVLKHSYIIAGEGKNLVDHWGSGYNKIFSVNPIGIVFKIDRHFMLAKNLSISDKKFLFAKETLMRNISHSEDKKTSLHTISITVSAFPELSQQIIDLIFESIINYSNEVTNTKGKEKREFIQSRLSEVEIELESAENELLLFLEKNKNLNSPSLNLQNDRLERNIMLHNQLYISLSDQLEIARIDEKDNTSSIFLLDDATSSYYKSGRSLFKSIFLILVIIFVITTSFEVYKYRHQLFI